jgi:hypothetical protein
LRQSSTSSIGIFEPPNFRFVEAIPTGDLTRLAEDVSGDDRVDF